MTHKLESDKSLILFVIIGASLGSLSEQGILQLLPIFRFIMGRFFGVMITESLSYTAFWGVFSIFFGIGLRNIIYIRKAQWVSITLLLMLGALTGGLLTTLLKEIHLVSQWGFSSSIRWGFLAVALLLGFRRIFFLSSQQIFEVTICTALGALGGGIFNKVISMFIFDMVKPLFDQIAIVYQLIKSGSLSFIFYVFLSFGVFWGLRKLLNLQASQIVRLSLFIGIAACISSIIVNLFLGLIYIPYITIPVYKGLKWGLIAFSIQLGFKIRVKNETQAEI